MTMQLEWRRGHSPGAAEVGMVYLQRGLRWIPSYHVEIDGKGTAHIKLQATLVNELVDLENVTAHLVVGVPQFTFANTPDPISMQSTVAQLSSAFQTNSQTANAFSNILTQQRAMVVRHSEFSDQGTTIDLGPSIDGAEGQEDLFVFSLEGVTLAEGDRMVVPISEFEIPYHDIFVLELPYGPPAEARIRFQNQQQRELARILNAPTVNHVIRLDNTSANPLTTAPAVILQDGRLLAQSLMTYTAIGASSDVRLTTAVDVDGSVVDVETKRTPDALISRGHHLDRIDMEGKVRLANYRSTDIKLEVRRFVLGNVTTADHKGSVQHVGWQSSGAALDGEFPPWWNWYSWPSWWYSLNPIGQIDWENGLAPGETVELTYSWHYFWD
jgi:hypothetical protein